jgi:thiol-disulfide isomerase/thioredoxin
MGLQGEQDHMLQPFIKHRLLGLVLALTLGATGVSTSYAKGGKTTWIHRAGSATLPTLFQAELKKAKRQKKQVVVLFTADWCAPCHAIKDLIETSKVVQKKTRKGHFVIIDVDEWRGPAHQLIPGINPSKLPTIVRVDGQGRSVLRSGGTNLGLLSEEDTGNNLARLIKGLKPLRPAYESNPTLKRELIKRAAERARKKKNTKSTEPTAKILGQFPGKPPSMNWVLKVTLPNPDSRRRFFAVSTVPGEALTEQPQVGSYEVVKFDEHVRANITRFYGQPSFDVIPVASKSFVELGAWRLQGWDKTKTWIDVWELERATIDGQAIQFDKKVPYELTIEDATATKTVRTYNGPVKVLLRPKKKVRVQLR